MTLCCRVVSHFAFIILYVVLQYFENLFFYDMATSFTCLFFFFPVVKDQADALYYLHNKLLGSGKEE